MNTLTYDAISRLAQSLWREQGCPAGRDTEIWLEAERQLSPVLAQTGDRKPESFAERAKTETAAESVVEYHISPAGSEQEAIQAAMQKPKARAPKAKPPEFGKNLSKKLRPPEN